MNAYEIVYKTLGDKYAEREVVYGYDEEDAMEEFNHIPGVLILSVQCCHGSEAH